MPSVGRKHRRTGGRGVKKNEHPPHRRGPHSDRLREATVRTSQKPQATIGTGGNRKAYTCGSASHDDAPIVLPSSAGFFRRVTLSLVSLLMVAGHVGAGDVWGKRQQAVQGYGRKQESQWLKLPKYPNYYS
ncbi:hypothetical protein R6Q59_016057 [Mikania micrantha]